MRAALLAALLAAPLHAQTYQNPLPLDAGPMALADTCADPTVERDDALGLWVMLCTTDPLGGQDRDADGALRFRILPTYTSPDLVRWTYRGDAFDRDPSTATPPPPAWAAPDAALWAPELIRLGGRWRLLFAVTDVTDAAGGEPACDEDSAIGAAVSESPLGPWTPAPAPLVAPRRDASGCEFLWTLDPEVEPAEDGAVLYYGSFHGGLEARRLDVAPDGALSAPGPATPIARPGRYEGAEVVRLDAEDGGWWVLMASAAACCAGPQTGYGVFAARARDPLGPFLDRDGHSLLEPAIGGTPVLMQNGNAWVGPGHNTVTRDAAGRWWTIYHAVEEAWPFLDGEPGFTRRPALLDPLDWEDGWPVVAGGLGPSQGPRPAPAARPGDPAAPPTPPPPGPWAGEVAFADAFDGPALDPGWAWLRLPPDATFAQGALRLSTSAGELWGDTDDAPLLLRPAPPGDFALEARVALDAPPACCDRFAQAGLVLWGGDDAYLKLVVAAMGTTRQVEFGRELPDPPEGAPFYGNAVGGPAGRAWTTLRLEVRREGEAAVVTAWSRADGGAWRRGATWRHRLDGMRLGLVAMGGAGLAARFDDLAVLAP